MIRCKDGNTLLRMNRSCVKRVQLHIRGAAINKSRKSEVFTFVCSVSTWMRSSRDEERPVWINLQRLFGFLWSGVRRVNLGY